MSQARDVARWLHTHSLLATVIGVSIVIAWLMADACFSAWITNPTGEVAMATANYAAQRLRLHASESPHLSCLHANEVGVPRQSALMQIAGVSAFADNFRLVACMGAQNPVAKVRHRGHRCEPNIRQTDDFFGCIRVAYVDLAGKLQEVELFEKEAYCAQHMAMISDYNVIKNC